MKFDKKLKDLKIALKSFSKDDLLIIFVPVSYWSQELLNRLQEFIEEDQKVENNVLILPDSFDVKKINFTGIEGKEVGKIDFKNDGIKIRFVDKISKDSENK